MKAKVIIENGLTEIVLTPENEFEIDLIEKVEYNKKNYSINTEFKCETAYASVTSKHEISMIISKLNRTT